MEAIRRQYYRFLLVFMALLCVFCVALSFWAIRSAENAQVTQTYQEIYSIKREFLKDTVRNMISEIARIRGENRNAGLSEIARLRTELLPFADASTGRAGKDILHVLERDEYTQCLNILLEDPAAGRILLQTGQARISGRYSETLKLGAFRLRLGVNEERVDELTKASVTDIIHGQKFQSGTYLWVNEIHQWSGGDNYAIRRIHPNLRETEGSLLSTNTRDIQGNLPYLEELLGVRDHGELYYTYFFKKPGSEEIGEKLSYATLYRDYNWIVAMGIYLDDIQVYVDGVRKGTAALTLRVAAVVAVSSIVLFLSAIFALSWMEKWYMRRTSATIRIESNTDPLTGALNRRIGTIRLQDSFDDFKRGMEAPALFSFDLDNFKRVNDTYGHDAGDLVLKAVVGTVRANMRSTDLLFRWGGEEFLLMCFGIRPDFMLSLAEKLNREVAATQIEIGTPDAPKTIRVTISIGISRFSADDASMDAAVKRADEAMYQAKAEGKNCARSRTAFV